MRETGPPPEGRTSMYESASEWPASWEQVPTAYG
jgi:hypothetical protein